MFKRVFDFVIAAALLALLSPIALLVTAAIILTMGRPALFRQARAGYKAEPFSLLKFRTMTDARDEDGNLLPSAQRLTALGRLLRKTSLDELPQLVNVLKGDLSMVGPRPLYVRYTDYYTEEERRRHDVKPGVTGLVQVSGRSAPSWEERLRMDVRYVDNRSMLLDLRILLLTPWKIVTCADITPKNAEIMERLDKIRQPRQRAA
ncbi:MAG: sugar transferase [Armatimonadota bacterium]|nr:sugar transferase [Armatimonadota bacterium]